MVSGRCSRPTWVVRIASMLRFMGVPSARRRQIRQEGDDRWKQRHDHEPEDDDPDEGPGGAEDLRRGNFGRRALHREQYVAKWGREASNHGDDQEQRPEPDFVKAV